MWKRSISSARYIRENAGQKTERKNCFHCVLTTNDNEMGSRVLICRGSLLDDNDKETDYNLANLRMTGSVIKFGR